MASNGQKTKLRHISEQSYASEASTDSGEPVPLVPQPPDGGWGWVIMTASLFCNFIVDGIGYAFGVFLLEFVDYFNSSKGKTSFVGSLLCGMYLLAGPVVSALTNRYGCRRVTICGSLLATLAFLICTLSQNIDILILTYGVLGGIGFGMIYLPSIVSVGYYFERKRAFATGIAVCGSGIGTFVFPPLCTYLLNIYGWKNTMYILAGIVLNGVVCGSLMRPLEAPKPKPKRRKRPRTKNVIDRLKEQARIARHRSESECSAYHACCNSTKNTTDVLERVMAAKLAREKRIREECDSESDFGSLMGTPGTGRIVDIKRQMSSPDGNITPPPSIPAIVVDEEECSGKPVPNGHTPSGSPRGPIANGKLPNVHTHPCCGQTCEDNTPNAEVTTPNGQTPATTPGDDDTEFTPLTSSVTSPTKDSSRFLSPSNIVASFRSLSHIWRKDSSDEKDPEQKLREEYARPMYRQDIFYSGSVYNIPQFRSQPDVQQYVTSITSIPPEVPEEQEDWLWKKLRTCCSKSTIDTLKVMLDISLLKNPGFLFICIGNIFGMCGFYVPFVYITDRAFHLGVDPSDAAFLVSIIGITNTIGRVVSGILADLPKVDSLLLNNIALAISGVLTLLSPFCTSYATLVIYASLFGFCISAYISLSSIILCDLLGLEKLTNAFGLLTMARGISAIVGPPIAGAIYDSSGSYDISFYVSGTLIIIAAGFHFILFLPCFKRDLNQNKHVDQNQEEAFEMEQNSSDVVSAKISVV